MTSNAGRKRFIVYGAGAIGGVIGSRLHRAGQDVVLIARGEHLRAIQARGLKLLTPQGALTQSIPTVSHPREIRFAPDDVVLLATKTQDTARALHDLSAAQGDLQLPVICAQNGVENERLCARSHAHVYAMMVWMPATFVEPGVVGSHSGPRDGILDLGRYPGGTDGISDKVALILEASNFSARSVPDIMRWKYWKLLSNVRAVMSALCGREGAKSRFADQLVLEAEACYRAAGINAASEEEGERRMQQADSAEDRENGPPRVGGSVAQSLVRQTGGVETDYINGEIAMLGTLHGVDVRHNRAALACANKMAAARLAPGTWSLAELERLAASFG